jgi:hypothetical protein
MQSYPTRGGAASGGAPSGRSRRTGSRTPSGRVRCKSECCSGHQALHVVNVGERIEGSDTADPTRAGTGRSARMFDSHVVVTAAEKRLAKNGSRQGKNCGPPQGGWHTDRQNNPWGAERQKFWSASLSLWHAIGKKAGAAPQQGSQLPPRCCLVVWQFQNSQSHPCEMR